MSHKIENTDKKNPRKFTGKIPDPVIRLSRKAKKWYYVICKELIEVDGFISPDVIVISQFCKALDLYIKIAERLKTADDCVQTFENGTSNISGNFTAYTKLTNQLKELAPQIGVTLKSRQNVNQFVQNQLVIPFGEDPWQAIRDGLR